MRSLVRQGEKGAWTKLLTQAYSERHLRLLRDIIWNSPLEWTQNLYPVTGRESWHWDVAELFWERAYPGYWRTKIVEVHGREYTNPRTQPVPVLEYGLHDG